MSDVSQTSSLANDMGSSVKTSSNAAPSIGQLFASLSTQMSSLVRGEIELTKMKAASFASRMGLAIGLLVGAAVFALYLLGWTFHAVEVALKGVVPPWAAALIVVGILLLIVVVLALLGVRELKRAQRDTPAPKEGLAASMAAFKKGLRHE